MRPARALWFNAAFLVESGDSMAITFYYGSGSPFAWRVWLALELKGVEYTQKIISFSDREHKSPDYLALNPRGKVPLIVDDGFALYESAAIVEYLDERFAQGVQLFPGDVRQRAVVRRLVQEADQYLGTSMEGLLNQVLFRPREQWDDARIAKAREQFATEIAAWETIVTGPWLAGADLSAADLTAYPHLALALRLDKRKPDLDIAGLVGPRMRAWMAKVEALPCFEKTIPPHWKK